MKNLQRELSYYRRKSLTESMKTRKAFEPVELPPAERIELTMEILRQGLTILGECWTNGICERDGLLRFGGKYYDQNR